MLLKQLKSPFTLKEIRKCYKKNNGHSKEPNKFCKLVANNLQQWHGLFSFTITIYDKHTAKLQEFIPFIIVAQLIKTMNYVDST